MWVRTSFFLQNFFFFHLKKPTNKKTTLPFPEIPVLLTSCWLIQELFFSFFFFLMKLQDGFLKLWGDYVTLLI